MPTSRKFMASQVWFPLLVLAVSLASTFYLWRNLDRGITDRAEQLFRNRTEEISSQIVKRLHDHEQVLLGGNALFQVKGDAVTRSDWRHYVSALKLGENHPGILGVGYSEWLSPERLEEHIGTIRAEGFPEYVIRPAGERPVYTSIIWLEPFNWRNQRAFGYDMYTEPVRRAAMARARDTGTTTVAAKVILVQETDHDRQSGMLMYVPSYRQGMPTDTVEERRAALRGFVYSPIRMNDFVLNTLTELPSDIEFEIHVGAGRPDRTLMFSSGGKNTLPEEYRPAFSSEQNIQAYGVDWRFTYQSLPAFDKELNRSKSRATLFTGILSSILLSTLAFIQARSRRQALAVADERLRAETRIRETVERLRLATDVAGLGIWSWQFGDDTVEVDARLQEWYAIPESMRQTGVPRDLLSSRVHPDDVAGMEASLDEARRRGIAWEREFRIVLPDGQVRFISAAAIVEHDRAGRPLRMIGINHDMTPRRELEENLRLAKEAAEEANRAKSEFLANMSHEIRTPMTVFLGVLDHLQELDAHSEHKDLLEMAGTSARRLRALIEDILDFSRIEARRVELHEEPVPLRICVEEAVSLLSRQAEEKGLALKVAIAPAVPELVLTDRDRLGQVLVNLVGNAVKFTDRGEVKVAVEADGQNLIFAVADTGAGIPAEKQDLLFQLFSQVDNSRRRRHGGTGLGLAISKGLVELMGGAIRVESRPGQGSTFSFTLPCKMPYARLRSPAEIRQPAEVPPGGARILLAEDEPAVREMIRIAVSRRGYRVETAEDGEQAVRRWGEGEFDLILMDVQMPKVDGVEATRTIRRLERERGSGPVPIIALTAHGRREIQEECLSAGMDAFVTKPVDTRRLYAAIENRLPR